MEVDPNGTRVGAEGFEHECVPCCVHSEVPTLEQVEETALNTVTHHHGCSFATSGNYPARYPSYLFFTISNRKFSRLLETKRAARGPYLPEIVVSNIARLPHRAIGYRKSHVLELVCYPGFHKSVQAGSSPEQSPY